MSAAAWLLLGAALTLGTLARTIPRPRPADSVAWRATPSPTVARRAPRAARRAAVAPAPSPPRRSKAADRAEKQKAAALLLLLVLGRDRVAAGPR